MNSILAGLASAHFSFKLGASAVFDCRVSQLPRRELITDYFRWRQEDACRNALNAHCYWQLRKEGKSVRQATDSLMRLSSAEKYELLFKSGTNFNALPRWQKRGVGVTWESYEKEGFNPKSGVTIMAQRRRLQVSLDLPMKDAFATFLLESIESSEHAGVER